MKILRQTENPRVGRPILSPGTNKRLYIEGVSHYLANPVFSFKKFLNTVNDAFIGWCRYHAKWLCCQYTIN